MNSSQQRKIYADPENAVRYFFLAARLEAAACSQSSDEENLRAHALATILLACSAVEAFLNVWCRQCIQIGQVDDAVRQSLTENVEDKRFPIWRKLIEWPNALFDAKLPQRADQHPPYQAFAAMYERRNRLMHYRSTNETLNVGQKFEFSGWTDVSEVRSLKASDAERAIAAAESVVEEILRIAYLDPQGVLYPKDCKDLMLRVWTGKGEGV